MKAVVIGGCGHIGTYLVPMLVHYGFEVINVSRGLSKPYTPHAAWKEVRHITMDRNTAEAEGVFGKKIADLNPDVVIDLPVFELSSVQQMVEALKGTNLTHYLYCSSIWAHGHATVVPAPEDLLPRHPIEEYGRQKYASEMYLHDQYRRFGFPETVVMPGHITGPGWNFITPCGNLDPMTFQRIGRGEKIVLANAGMETIHNVHAEDVAQVFMKSITHRNQALGESFHATAPFAMTMLGAAEGMFEWFGQEPNIDFLPWEEWKAYTKDQGFINSTYSHIYHSDNYSIEKGRRLLEYQPRYTILEAMQDGVRSMIERKVISI